VACWSMTGGDAVPAVKGWILSRCGLFEQPSVAACVTEPIPASASRRAPLAAAAAGSCSSPPTPIWLVWPSSPRSGYSANWRPPSSEVGCSPVSLVVGVGVTSRFIGVFWTVPALSIPTRRPVPVVPRLHPEGPASSCARDTDRASERTKPWDGNRREPRSPESLVVRLPASGLTPARQAGVVAGACVWRRQLLP
jgi:hypothetical protein